MQITLLKNSPTPIWKRTLLWLGIILIIIAMAYLIASSQDFYRAKGKDFFSLWLAPRLILDGKNPYNPEDWVPAHTTFGAKWVSDSTFLYPLPVAVFLLPLGLVSLEYAAVLWVTLSILAILLAVSISLHNWRNFLSASYYLPILIGVFFFRPVTVTLWLGQIDGLILVLLALGQLQWQKQNWFIGSIIVTLSIIKPQIGFPLIAFLTVWLIIRRLWNAMLGVGITLFVFYMVGWLFDHYWLFQWIEISRSKNEPLFCCTPTIWGLGSALCNFNPGCGVVLGIIIALGLCSILLVLLAPIPTGEVKFVFGLSIPVALLVSPYLWTYSQISLLIPIMIIQDFLKNRQLPYLLVAPYTLYVALFTSGIVFLSIKIGVDVLSSLVPLVVFAMLILCFRYNNDNEGLPSGYHSLKNE